MQPERDEQWFCDLVIERLRVHHRAFRAPTFEPSSTFNEPSIIGGEEAEDLFADIARAVGVDEEAFARHIRYDAYFEPEHNIASLPLVPFWWLLNRLNPRPAPRLVTIAEFARTLHQAFGSSPPEPSREDEP